jgi:ATP-dependent helicase HrpB
MNLPVEASIQELRAVLQKERAAVLVAPPGSGKTTIVPLRLLDDIDGTILVLEPRRVATRAAARRMAHLLGEDLGDTVGYVTRDDRRIGPSTRIQVVTEGVLTRRIQRDPALSGVGLVIFDEFHERNLQTDLGLALVLDTRSALRPDLALLVMSATLDADRVATLLGTRVIESQTAMHPVDIRWAPQKRKGRIEDHVTSIVMQALDREVGDILVFLPGIGEIDRITEQLEQRQAACEIHRLHGSLPIEEQDAAITPSMRRKVVLATDIAETSLTVEGVRIVVDSGLARAPRFDTHTGMTRLRTIPISRASADQRAGRAGRTEPGIAYRLWSKIEHGTRRAHIDPEIGQVDLTGLLLEVKTWGANSSDDLIFLDPPPPKAVADAEELLGQLGALDEAGHLTDMGRRMSELPLHPRLAHMILDSDDDAGLACVLAAVVDERDPFPRSDHGISVDISIRVAAVAGVGSERKADRRRLARIRRTAEDLARRSHIGSLDVNLDRCGIVLAKAFPDRVAIKRGSAGKFQLRTGTTAWVPNNDPLAVEACLVAADLDGKRKDSRIRLAAALDLPDLEILFADHVEHDEQLGWSGDRLVMRRTSRLGGLTLSETEQRADPSEATIGAVIDAIRRKPSLLEWPAHVAALRARVQFAARHQPDAGWPDWTDTAIIEGLDEWLGPDLWLVTSLEELHLIDLGRILERQLGRAARSRLDRLVPTHLELPSGRRLPIDYSGDEPGVASRVQDFFGVRSTPTVAGVPIVVTLLSPANRPVQVTRDLGGFWEGSWADVRKDMAGRYPKHEWPERP